MYEYDGEYDADDEYDINDEEDRFEAIDKQVFINIGAYMGQLFNEPLAELAALHGCRRILAPLEIEGVH